MRYLLTTVLSVILLLGISGCGTMNGFGADTENAGRWLREVTQKNVDNTELRRIRSAIDTQNRIISRGLSLQEVTDNSLARVQR